MFKDFLTTEGERLLAKSIAGTATITITKMMIGDGDRGTSTKAITSLESPKLTLDIYSVLLSGDNNIEITTMLDSSAIPDGFYFREKGIYATDGTTEILFMYGTSGSLAEWLDNLDNAVFTRTIRTIITLSESDNVSITIQKGAYASGEDAENILAAIQNIKPDGDWAKYSQAENILSLLDALCTAYTALRAGKLDNLDALVSSRAPANTALSNGVWTNARAAALDNLDAKISSRAQASTALSNAVWTDARASYLDNIINGAHGLPIIASYAYQAHVNVANALGKLDVLLSKVGGDYAGKRMLFEQVGGALAVNTYVAVRTFSHAAGGVARITLPGVSWANNLVQLVIDGTVVFTDVAIGSLFRASTQSGSSAEGGAALMIPFDSTFTISVKAINTNAASDNAAMNIAYYLNK